MRQEIEAMRAQLEQKDSERAESLSGITMDVIDVNEELDQVKSGLTHATDGISWLDLRLKPLEGLGNQTEVNLGEIHEQIRLLRAEQEALRTEVFKLSDEIQTAKTGPQASELQQLLLETKQTRYDIISVGFPRVSERFIT
jgi:chromosome segregation ATPase